MLSPRPVSATSSVYLDLFRALAALAVFSSHVRQFFFVDYSHIQPQHLNVFVRIFYFLTRFGRQSVMIFFVLSGFLIGSSVLRKVHEKRFSWRDYSLDRAARLYTVLLPGLLLGALWDTIGIHLFNATGIYSAELRPLGPNVPIYQRSFLDFVGNLLFLQTRFVPVFGSNSPLWSLFNEAWYYVLFPLLVLFLIRKRRIYYLLLAAACLFVLREQTLGFIIWLFGCVVSLIKERRGPLTWLFISVCTLALAIALPFGNDLAIGISFAFLLYWTLQLDRPINSVVSNCVKSCAAFSYSLYILHFPALFLIRAAFTPREHWQPDARHLLYSAGISAAVLLYCYLVSLVTEAKTPIVRAWMHATYIAINKSCFRDARR